MPHCIVEQPDGKYALWSTIIDDFLVFDCSAEEAIESELAERGNYPGGQEAKRKALETEIENIQKSGVAWDWAKGWNECVRYLEQYHRDSESLVIIDQLKLPRRMKPRISSMKREKYWKYYWYAKCGQLEAELRKLKMQIGAGRNV